MEVPLAQHLPDDGPVVALQEGDLVGIHVGGLEVLVGVRAESLAERSGEVRVELPVAVVPLVKCPSEVLAQLLWSVLTLVEEHESSPAEEYVLVPEPHLAGESVTVPEVIPVGVLMVVLVGDPGSDKGPEVWDVFQQSSLVSVECSEWNVLGWTERTADHPAEVLDWVALQHLSLTEGTPVEGAENGDPRKKC